MIKVNVTYKNDSGETIKIEQREVDVEFDMELTPADLAAAEDAEKTVEDLVTEQVLTELSLSTDQLTPRMSSRFSALVPGEAMEEGEVAEEPPEDKPGTINEAG